jgi:hypothetical protein
MDTPNLGIWGVDGERVDVGVRQGADNEDVDDLGALLIIEQVVTSSVHGRERRGSTATCRTVLNCVEARPTALYCSRVFAGHCVCAGRRGCGVLVHTEEVTGSIPVSPTVYIRRWVSPLLELLPWGRRTRRASTSGAAGGCPVPVGVDWSARCRVPLCAPSREARARRGGIWRGRMLAASWPRRGGVGDPCSGVPVKQLAGVGVARYRHWFRSAPVVSDA